MLNHLNYFLILYAHSSWYGFKWRNSFTAYAMAKETFGTVDLSPVIEYSLWHDGSLDMVLEKSIDDITCQVKY